MTGVFETVHVAWGTSRADAIKEALRSRGCGERVIALTHDLSVGPIDSLDADARQRWFAANMRSDDDPDEGTTDPEAPWAEATDPGVHPVYWVCLTDAAEHACFLRFVTRMAGRPFDIVEFIGSDFPRPGATSPVWSLGQLRPEEIVAADLGGVIRRGIRTPFSG